MAVVLALGLLIAGGALLIKGADWFTDGAGDLARSLGVSALLIGIVLAGLEPEEMLTAAIAAGRGATDLAVGNVIGTNVTMVTLALGLGAVLLPIHLNRSTRTQAVLATLASIPPIILLYFGLVPRWAGIALLAGFVVYTVVLIRVDRTALQRYEALEALETGDDDSAAASADTSAGPPVYTPRQRREYVMRKARALIGGLLAMALGGPAIVEGALRLAGLVGLRQSAVGLTVVSLGTGAEMVALAITAARRRKSEILVGGIIGSFAYNLLVTLGLAAAIHPLVANSAALRLALLVMIVAHLALLALVFVGRIPRWVGIVLLAGYVAYVLGVVLAQ
ncbi:MAG TPA: sodium:calcium antiporter [Ktedonobacterales bacterium]|nr:sodium:calcium antiporter [Ktedonobacterales bacterium]